MEVDIFELWGDVWYLLAVALKTYYEIENNTTTIALKQCEPMLAFL